MIYEMTIPQFIKMLTNLNHFFDKASQYAQEKNFDIDILLNARLAPNMFHVIKQVQIACDAAKYCASRLSGKSAPVNDDSEKTLAEVKARIEGTITYLKSFQASDFIDAEKKSITQPRWEGKTLSGLEYVTHNAIPNVYFHITTAYAILRQQGVDLGKSDYLGEMPFKK